MFALSHDTLGQAVRTPPFSRKDRVGKKSPRKDQQGETATKIKFDTLLNPERRNRNGKSWSVCPLMLTYH